jgi:hypothetical protein
MRPDELLGDRTLRDVSQFSEEGSPFKVNVEAVSKAKFLFSKELVRLNIEGVTDFSSALLEASDGFSANLLSKA